MIFECKDSAPISFIPIVHFFLEGFKKNGCHIHIPVSVLVIGAVAGGRGKTTSTGEFSEWGYELVVDCDKTLLLLPRGDSPYSTQSDSILIWFSANLSKLSKSFVALDRLRKSRSVHPWFDLYSQREKICKQIVKIRIKLNIQWGG